MICKNCGEEFSDELTVCPSCKIKTVKKAKKALSKKAVTKIVAISLTIVTLILIVVFAIVPLIKNNLIANKTPNDYLKYVLVEKGDFSSDTANTVSAAKAIFTGDVGVTTKSSIEIKNSLYKLIAELDGVPEKDIKEKFSWFKEYELSIGTVSKDNLLGIQSEQSLNGRTIITAQAIADDNTDKYYITSPELGADAIEIKVDGNTNNENGMALYILGHLSDFAKTIPDKKVLDKIIDRYLDIVFENLSDVTKSNGTIKVGDISQKCTVTTVNFTHEDFYNITKHTLETFKSDSEANEALSSMLIPVCDLIKNEIKNSDNVSSIEKALAISLITPETLLSSLNSNADNILEALKTDNRLNFKEKIQFKIWTNGKHEIIGIAVIINDREMLAARSAAKGSKFEDEILIDINGTPVKVVSGNGKISFGKKTGNYSIGVESEYIHAELKNFDISKWYSKGQMSGSLTIKVGSDFPKNFLTANFNKNTSDAIKNISMKFDFKSGITQNEITTKLRYKNKDAIILKFVAKAKKSGKPISPEKIYNASEKGYNEFVLNSDFDKIIKNLEKANLPDNLIDLVQNRVSFTKKMAG
ncbi:MAG: hypothetical protein IKI97_06105 [Clostridia bacterium]|nr:hypothetical protein [Clostridia bacterium]